MKIVHWTLGIIIGVWIIFSLPYIKNGLVPFPSTYLVSFFAPWSATNGQPVKNNAMPDIITQIYPWKRVTIDAWMKGELPLWNPYSFSGTSHLANYQTAVFSPLNVLFMFMPEIHAWSVMILLQPILAGIFMYMFIVALGKSKESASIAALAYMFSGFMVVWMAYGTLSYAVLYLPFILWCILNFYRTGLTKFAAGICLGVALSFFSGHFQMSTYVFLYALAFGIFFYVQNVQRKRALWAIVSIVMGVLLAAPQIFPAYGAYTDAVRSSLFGKGEVIPWQYIITIFSPDFFGNPVTRNDWFGHYAEWASYIGVLPLILSVFAIWRKFSDKFVRFFLTLAILAMLLAFPTPLQDLLYAIKIPVLSTSSASRIIVLMSFSLAVLSAYGFDELMGVWEKRQRKVIKPWIVFLTLFLLIVWGILLGLPTLPADKLTIAVRNTLLPTAFTIIIGVLTVLASFIPRKLRVYIVVAFIVLTAFDLVRFASKWMPFDPPQLVFPKLPVIAKVRELTQNDSSRVFGNIGNEVGSTFGISLVEGYDPVYQERYGKFITSAAKGTLGMPERSVVTMQKRGEYTDTMLNLLGVQYYIHKKSDGRFDWAYPFWDKPHFKSVWQDDHFEIVENLNAMPRAYLVGDYVRLTTESEIIDTILSPTFDTKSTIVLEDDPPIKPKPGNGNVSLISYTQNSVSLKTEADTPKLLFLSDVFDSGWQVSIDGNRSPLLRANYAFRAVAVPAGAHTIRMWYWPKSITVGLGIAGFVTLSIVAVLMKVKRI